MSLYRTTVDTTIRNSSQVLALELVGPDRDVLDVGCAAGDLARALAERGCRVSGIEIDAEAAEEARPVLQKLVIGSIADTDLVEAFGTEAFDAIVFGDVLEHLVDPDGALAAALPLLRPDGEVVISVPNVTHGALRLALLQGRWQYTDAGLLDKTHLRFFTRESFLAMVRRAGLQVTDFYATIIEPLQSEVQIDDSALPGAVVDWVRHQPDSFVYQFVVKARRGDVEAQVPDTIPAVPVPVAGPDDVHVRRAANRDDPGAVLTERDALLSERQALLSEVVDLRRRVLTLRDQAIGAAAEVGTARAEATRLAHEQRRAADEVTHLRDLVGGLSRELEALRGSLSFRLGNGIVRPISGLARKVRGA